MAHRKELDALAEKVLWHRRRRILRLCMRTSGISQPAIRTQTPHGYRRLSRQCSRELYRPRNSLYPCHRNTSTLSSANSVLPSSPMNIPMILNRERALSGKRRKEQPDFQEISRTCTATGAECCSAADWRNIRMQTWTIRWQRH